MTDLGGPDGGGPDPWNGFDEAWVAGAPIQELSADERVVHAEAIRLRMEERALEERQAHRRGRRKRRIRWVAVLAVVAVFAGLINLADRIAKPDDEPTATWTGATDGFPEGLLTGDRPTLSRPASATRLGTPSDPTAAGGAYDFLGSQAGSDDPITYDPCRAITVVVNDEHAPDGATDILSDALDRISQVSGLTFDIEDSTVEPATVDREAFQPDRYGDRWAPVLVAWTDPAQVPVLSGDVAGLAGSQAVEVADRQRVYVTGIVLLDGPQFDEILDQPEGDASARDVVLHELGHLLGLAHVNDASELMYPESLPGVHGLQRGDRTGLTRLGQGRCPPEL